MADQFRQSDLPYGHFGNATYDIREHEWRFTRLSAAPYVLQPVNTESQSPAPSRAKGVRRERLTSKEERAVRHKRQIKDLIRLHPDVQPGVALLPELMRVSEAVDDASSRYDPAKGPLLSAGIIYDKALHFSAHAIAFPSGPTGSDLCVALVQSQKQGWNDFKDAWLEVPAIRGVEAVWHGPGAPIQQVAFAQPAEDAGNSAFLAVRMLNETLIFRPALQRAGPDRLDVNLILEVPLDGTGGRQHSDVVFNSSLPRQFGIIDRTGSWSIWELEGRMEWRMNCLHHSTKTNENEAEKIADDGWARMTWVGGSTVVAVCTRRDVTLYDTAAEIVSPQPIDVGLEAGVGSILDINVVSSRPRHLFILTSTHLLVYYIRSSHNRQNQVSNQWQARHFRDPQDMSLQMKAFSEDEDIIVILRSSLNPVMLCYRVKVSDMDESDLSVSDPSELQLSQDQRILDFADMHMQSISYYKTRSANTEGTRFGSYKASNVRFTSLMLLTKDFATQEPLLFASSHEKPSIEIMHPHWKAKLSSGVTRLNKEDFLADDEIEVSDRKPPVSTFVQQRMQNTKGRLGPQWTVDYTSSARDLEVATNGPTKDVIEALEGLRHAAVGGDPAQTVPMRCISEALDGEYTVLDIEQASGLLHELSQMDGQTPSNIHEADTDVEQTTRIVIRKVDLPSFPDLGPVADPALIYDTVVSDWISPLAPGVSGRVRLAKEQIARRIAAQVALASHVQRVEEKQTMEMQGSTQTNDQSRLLQLPIRSAIQASSPWPSSEGHDPSRGADSSVLLTPSTSGPSSVITGSSDLSSFAAPEASRLSRYTTFSKALPTALPRSVHRVLRHWTVGADPATYDWLKTSRHITQLTEEEEVDSQLTEQERARLKRKAERHINRQRREAAASQQQRLASSQMPAVVVSASQPALDAEGRSFSQPKAAAPEPAAGSSSQALPIQSASQAVPGKYGSRPAKKKRKMGF